MAWFHGSYFFYQCRHKQNTSPMDLMWWEWTSVELVKWRRGEVCLLLQCVSHSEGPPEILISWICLRWVLTFHHGKSPLKLPFLYQTYKAKNIGIPILKTDQQFFFTAFAHFDIWTHQKYNSKYHRSTSIQAQTRHFKVFWGPRFFFHSWPLKRSTYTPEN